MKRFCTAIFYILIITVFTTCKTDFDVTAPYKETMIVYGLLNASDTIHWVRINKAFLGDGNAYTMAQQPDSINYPDILDVKMEQINSSGSVLKTLYLTRDSSIPKEPGTFATTPNILYRTNGNEKLVQESDYRLVIYNRETGKTVTAETNVVDSIFMTTPNPYVNPPFQVNWYQGQSYIIRYNSVPEGIDYQLTIRFHYDEVNLSNQSDIQPKQIDWVLPEQLVLENNDESQHLTQTVSKDDFYNFVKQNVSPNPSVERRIGTLDFIFTVASNEFYTYIQVNKPPTGVNQNIPQYTNIDEGLGIFSSRLKQYFRNFEMNPISKDSLIEGSITGDLQFVLF
ncbi:MAG TPA: hypothetical protein VJY62_12735 [Bacteroidia bacterium]|nr:hypothetical protein [Bacteroidia bacterium]